MKELCGEATLRYKRHRVESIPSFIDGRDFNMIYGFVLKFYLYIGSVEGCVPSIVLHGFQKAQP